jgi:Protein of unknown function (DUF2971)
MDDNQLPPVFSTAVEDFITWSRQQLRTHEEATKITEPLYHYTDAAGLCGIVKSQIIWFTSYLHLNDPSELIHGMDIVHRLLKAIGEGSPGLVKEFCDIVDVVFQHQNFSNTFGFYIASFSRNRNDLGQWRAYADNGRGFAIGLAPHLFETVETDNPKPTEYVVMPVMYEMEEAEQRYRTAIEQAVGFVRNNRPQDNVKMAFLRRMADELIAGQLIATSLTVKHKAYKNEEEVRLVMLGEREKQKNDLRTRIRGSEIVPFMEGCMPLRDRDGITEIVIGPAAVSSAEDAVYSLLQSLDVEPSGRIGKSKIPYTPH